MSKFFLGKLFSKGKVSPTIKSVKPTVPTTKIGKAMRDVNTTVLKTKGSMKKRSQDFDREINKVKSSLGQTMQKLKGEKVTESGVSKGKDRVNRRFGSPKPKPKTNVQKIKETFAPKGLKKINPQKQKGLAKLKKARPDVVRKMGYMKKGGVV